MLTVSDGAPPASGRDDVGRRARRAARGARLRGRARAACPTTSTGIATALIGASTGHRLIVTTGGTGLDAARRHAAGTPASSTTRSRASPRRCAPTGRANTPLADLVAASPASAGGADRQVPGSPRGRARVARGGRAGAGPRARDARRAVRPRAGRRHDAGGSRSADRRRDRGARPRPALSARVPLFCGAAALFALAMARHLRVFAAAHAGASPLRETPRRVGRLVRYAIVQVRMFRDLGGALMHAAIFWGFVILTIGTAERVTCGLVQAVARLAARRLAVALIVALRTSRAARHPRRRCVRCSGGCRRAPARLTYIARRLVILLLIGGVVPTELLAEAFRVARYGDQPPGRSSPNALAIAAASVGLSASGARRRASPSAGGRTSSWCRPSWCTCRAPSTSTSRRRSSTSTSASSRRAASCRRWTWRRETRTFGVKTIEDLGWKDLLDGFTCTECGRCQDACPAWTTGKPLNPKTFIMGIRDMASRRSTACTSSRLADRARDHGLDDRLSRGAREAHRGRPPSRTTRSGTA